MVATTAAVFTKEETFEAGAPGVLLEHNILKSGGRSRASGIQSGKFHPGFDGQIGRVQRRGVRDGNVVVRAVEIECEAGLANG